MAERSAIEWTDATWNPWRGCTKVSPGCASCYMFRDQARYGRDPEVVMRAAPATFNAPLKWKNPALVFTCSWSDFFHPDADEWRPEAWDIIRRTPHLTYQILTKRIDRVIPVYHPDHIELSTLLPPDWGDGYPNVWLGVSVENPRMTWRLDYLGAVPAAVRFVSAEPLLKPLDLMGWLRCSICDGGGVLPFHGVRTCPQCKGRGRYLDWVIVGGESGGRPGHPPRKMHPDWVRGLRDQCIRTGVPFHFKQWGGARPGGPAFIDSKEWRELPPVNREPSAQVVTGQGALF